MKALDIGDSPRRFRRGSDRDALGNLATPEAHLRTQATNDERQLPRDEARVRYSRRNEERGRGGTESAFGV